MPSPVHPLPCHPHAIPCHPILFHRTLHTPSHPTVGNLSLVLSNRTRRGERRREGSGREANPCHGATPLQGWVLWLSGSSVSPQSLPATRPSPHILRPLHHAHEPQVPTQGFLGKHSSSRRAIIPNALATMPGVLGTYPDEHVTCASRQGPQGPDPAPSSIASTMTMNGPASRPASKLWQLVCWCFPRASAGRFPHFAQ